MVLCTGTLDCQLFWQCVRTGIQWNTRVSVKYRNHGKLMEKLKFSQKSCETCRMFFLGIWKNEILKFLYFVSRECLVIF